jgi:four helix bundle protein
MDERMFKERTKQVALRVIRLVGALRRNLVGEVISRQLLRCGTSVGANYRAACRGKSVADAIAKLAVVEEEADETLYWLELIAAAGLMAEGRLRPLMKEVDEILAMTVASIKALRRRGQRIQNPKPKIENRMG